jgi:hypothetical protein
MMKSGRRLAAKNDAGTRGYSVGPDAEIGSDTLMPQSQSSVPTSPMLDISVRTDKVHRRNIHRKLSIHSQTGLFARFIAILNEGGRK